MYLTLATRLACFFFFASSIAATYQTVDVAAREALLQEVGTALAVNASSALGNYLSDIEIVLAPIVATSPKNEHGRLDDAASRYVLHRYFMQRHGWDMRTFVSGDNKADEDTCLFDFGRQVPFQVQAALEKRIDRGASVMELAVFVALLEHLIRNEVPIKLAAAYGAMGHSRTSPLDRYSAQRLVAFHMAMEIESADANAFNPATANMLLRKMPGGYAGWSYAEEMFQSAMGEFQPANGEYFFEDVLAIVNSLEDKLWQLQNHQCTGMKAKLLAIATPGSGRVPLPSFYESALTKGNMEFMESLDYLRQLGAVDEPKNSHPQVIISNYLDGPSNCIAASSYYSVCCLDECGNYYGQVEKYLGKPAATPEELLTALKSVTTLVGTNVSLSDAQTASLFDISKQKFGLIDLHGDAFAQWMHRVFPDECTDNAKFGPAYFMNLDEFAKTQKTPIAATVDAARQVILEAKREAKQATVAPGEIVEVEDDIVVNTTSEFAAYMFQGGGFQAPQQQNEEGRDREQPVEEYQQDAQPQQAPRQPVDADASQDRADVVSIADATDPDNSSLAASLRWLAFVAVAVLVPTGYLGQIFLAVSHGPKRWQADASNLESVILMDAV